MSGDGKLVRLNVFVPSNFSKEPDIVFFTSGLSTEELEKLLILAKEDYIIVGNTSKEQINQMHQSMGVEIKEDVLVFFDNGGAEGIKFDIYNKYSELVVDELKEEYEHNLNSTLDDETKRKLLEAGQNGEEIDVACSAYLDELQMKRAECAYSFA